MASKRGIKNVIFGLLYQAVVLAFGLITPRLLIVSYGSEMNGLLSSINQIYTYLALLEAGIGTATLQALYRTIAKNDKDATNGVMAATHYFYKRTGCFYLIGVIVLALVYPFVVSSEIPIWIVVTVILFNGLSGVINYFFQGKFRILLHAEGKSYLLSNLSTCTYILSNVAKIALIYAGYNVAVVQFAYFLVNLFPLAYISVYIKRNYKWLDLSVKPDFASISQKNAVLIHQISGLVFNNTDVILLTFFASLKTVSVYTLFAGFYNTVKSILFSFLDGLKFAMGQMFHKDFKQYIKLHDVFELYYMALTFAAYTVLQIFMLPFIRVYTAGITDINYVDPYLPILFTTVFLLQAARGPSGLAIDYAEHFKQTRWRAILEMAINLSVTIVGILWIGIYGALAGTIAALMYRTNDMIIYANKKILKRSPWITYRRWLLFCAVFLVFVFLSSLLPLQFHSYLELFIYALPSAIIILVVYLFTASIAEIDTYKNMLNFVRSKA